MRTPLVIAALAALVALPAGADDIGDAALELCEKLKYLRSPPPLVNIKTRPSNIIHRKVIPTTPPFG